MLGGPCAPVRLSGNLFLFAPVVINPERRAITSGTAKKKRKKKILHLQLCPLVRVIKWGHGSARTCSEASRGNLQATLHTVKHHLAPDERERKND